MRKKEIQSQGIHRDSEGRKNKNHTRQGKQSTRNKTMKGRLENKKEKKTRRKRLL